MRKVKLRRKDVNQKEYFSCKHARRQGAMCPAKIKVRRDQTGKIKVMQNQDHSEHEGTSISPRTKQEIIKQVAQKKTPAQIRDKLLVFFKNYFKN